MHIILKKNSDNVILAKYEKSWSMILIDKVINNDGTIEVFKNSILIKQ